MRTFLVCLILFSLQECQSFHYMFGNRFELVRRCTINMRADPAPWDDIIPFLSEHVEKSDQLLFLGCKTDLCVQMVKAGWGTEATGCMTVVDSDREAVEACRQMALADSEVKKWVDNGKLNFEVADLTNMPNICKQSVVDAIIDYGGLDSVLNGDQGVDGMLKTIDHLQDAVRLGNILVCLSGEKKEKFCSPFEERFGWVQELDGDPGELSAWYRGKSNISKTKSNFKELGLFMYVYTNVDNC